MKTVKEIEDRLQDLLSIKEYYQLQTKSIIWKNKSNAQEWTPPWSEDYRTQIWLTVKLQKDAELLASIPEWTFIPLDWEWRRNKFLIENIWKYWYLRDNTDNKISEAVQSATTYWTWIIFEWIKHIFKKVKEPYYSWDWNNRKILFKEKEQLVYSWIYSELIPFQNFLINWTNINNATEAIVIRFYDKDEYIASKELDPNYKNLNKIPNTKEYKLYWEIWDNFYWFNSNWVNTVLEIEYWNSALDEYIVIANWEIVKESPIPYTHKKLPFLLYLDNKSIERIYWIWEFELTEQEERYKNDLRTLLIKWVKYSIGFVLKDKLADIDAWDLYSWIWEVYTTSDINWIKQVSFQVPIWSISEAETKVDNDIIAKTWVDFRSQGLNQSETATKTQSKTLSARKRINKNIKDNAFNFFRRMAELRMANLKFIHSVKDFEIPIEWGTISIDWVFEPEENWGYGSAIINKDLVAWEFTVLPIIESLLWDTKQKRRDDIIQFSSLSGNIKDESWKPIIKPAQIVKLIAEEFWYDYWRLTESIQTSKSWEDILSELDKELSWTTWTPADENYVPPEQRNLQGNIPTLSWYNNTQNEW